jgi:aspartate kinase
LAQAVTIVQKYGGSSLADGAALRAVAQQMVAKHRQGCRLVVVVSAMGQATNELLAQAHGLVARPPQRELDMLVTAGERICMALLCMAVADLGGRAVSLTGSQSGIVTEDAHQGARIVAIRPQRILEVLDGGSIAVVAGYQGVSLKHEITTLGRGGSDTTAVALGAALGAAQVEIFSDVDGVYSADPRICPQARHLREISYGFMGKMAHFGAQVLHEQAVEFAKRAGIVLSAKHTGRPQGRSTRLHPAVSMPQEAMAVTSLAEAFCLEGGGPDDALDLVPALVAAGLRLVAMGPGALLCAWNVAVGADRMHRLDPLIQAPWRHRPVAAVTVVGHQDVPVWLPAARAALRGANIPVHAVFGEPEALTLAVPQALGGRAVALLHALIPA